MRGGGQKKKYGVPKKFFGASRRKWAPHFQFASYAPGSDGMVPGEPAVTME